MSVSYENAFYLEEDKQLLNSLTRSSGIIALIPEFMSNFFGFAITALTVPSVWTPADGALYRVTIKQVRSGVSPSIRTMLSLALS